MSLLASQLDAVEQSMPIGVRGCVLAIAGLTIEAANLPLPIGSLCEIHSFGAKITTAEVIGFKQDRTLLMPLTQFAGVSRGDAIVNVTASPRAWVSDELLGRVLDGFGKPIDGKAPLQSCQSRRIDSRAAAALSRKPIDTAIATGIRAIDGLHTCGMGQRMGIFSGPGVGKSTLMSSIAKNSSADVSVIALIGERGREVQDFIANALGPSGLQRCVVIVSTSDDPPLLRVRAAKVALTISEYFRDQGKNVVLLMDSLTRLAHAQRQIGLAAHEPPATRGYPPSVFALLPEILERAGRSQVGSITGFFTVLVEGDDFNEPIPDAVKGISDGHLWLSRPLANRGHYPAIDVLQSISRVRSDVVEPDQLKAARKILATHAIYEDVADLVNVGAYVPGANLEYDLAVQCRPRIVQFLQQDAATAVPLVDSKRLAIELATFIELREKQLQAPAKPNAAAPARSTQPSPQKA